MGRCREFKRESVLDKAMEVFWRKGYVNCSIKDLLDEMGILNGSFYNCFGSKKKLFIESLEHYGNTVTKKYADAISSKSDFKSGLREMFSLIYGCLKEPGTPRGCMVTGAINSGAAEDPEIKAYLDNQAQQFEKHFKDQIKLAQENNQISKDVDPEQVTPILVAYIHGIMSLTSVNDSDEKLAGQTHFFLTSIGL